MNTFTLAAEANRLQKETVRIGNIIMQLHNGPNIDWVKRLN